MIDHSAIVPALGFCARRANNLSAISPPHEWLALLHFFVRRLNNILTLAPANDWACFAQIVIRRINSLLRVAPAQDWYILAKTTIRHTSGCLHAQNDTNWLGYLKRIFDALIYDGSRFQTCMLFGSVVSHSRKAILWFLPRTGSRAISSVMTHMDFINSINKVPLADEHSHGIGIPKGCQDYHITATVRNPYSWVLSCWHIWGSGKTFKEYLNTQGALIPLRALNRTKHYREPDLWIRYEDMDADVLKIPCVSNDSQAVKLAGLLSTNFYAEEFPMGVLKRDPKNPRYTDYLSYYDQDDLDKVYTIYEEYFKKFGYKREFKDQSQPH